MITTVAARWLLTMVFAAAELGGKRGGKRAGLHAHPRPTSRSPIGQGRKQRHPEP